MQIFLITKYDSKLRNSDILRPQIGQILRNSERSKLRLLSARHLFILGDLRLMARLLLLTDLSGSEEILNNYAKVERAAIQIVEDDGAITYSTKIR